MIFEEAMRHLRYGKKIRKKNWTLIGYIHIESGNLVDEEGKKLGLLTLDVLADDWEIYEKKITITRDQFMKAYYGATMMRDDRILFEQQLADRLGL